VRGGVKTEGGKQRGVDGSAKGRIYSGGRIEEPEDEKSSTNHTSAKSCGRVVGDDTGEIEIGMGLLKLGREALFGLRKRARKIGNGDQILLSPPQGNVKI